MVCNMSRELSDFLLFLGEPILQRFLNRPTMKLWNFVFLAVFLWVQPKGYDDDGDSISWILIQEPGVCQRETETMWLKIYNMKKADFG